MAPRQEHTSTNANAQGLSWGTLPPPYMYRPWRLYPDKQPRAHLQQRPSGQLRPEPLYSQRPHSKLGHLNSKPMDKHLALCDLLAPGTGVMDNKPGT